MVVRDYLAQAREYWDERVKTFQRLACAPTKLREVYKTDPAKALRIFDKEIGRLHEVLFDFIWPLLEDCNSGKVLETGFGTGEFTRDLLKLKVQNRWSFTYAGVDISDEMLKFTREVLMREHLLKFVPRLRLGRASSLTEIRDKSKNGVIWGRIGFWLWNEEWIKALKEVNRIIMPGGWFVVYEPFRDTNPHWERLGKKNTVRYVQDYRDRLPNFTSEEPIEVKFCKESYLIIVFHKNGMG